jgi:aminopeptidase YwaD
MHRVAILLSLVAACSGSSAPQPPGPTDPATLDKTLMDLAAFGEKHVGTPGGAMAGSYVQSRMQQIGLTDVHLEQFSFPRHDVSSSSLALDIDGTPQTIGFDVFDGSGSGHADATLIYVGSAHPDDLLGKDLTGKIAVVERDMSYHRSTQFVNVTAAGASAMLYLSVAQNNLRQVGSVRRAWEAMGSIPAITIGADDGATIKAALTAGSTVHAVIDVQASITPASGNNVVATIPGKETGQIVIGAHFDTWFVGSSDNSSGVTALLALAERRMHEPKPRYTLVFVAYDGEEVGLYGGYDYLRHHLVEQDEPILAVLNFEMPAAKDTSFLGLARTNVPLLDDALRAGSLNFLYGLYVTLDVVPALFGGIIPTDIQGIYRAGVPTISTAVDSPYYHTTADTPDKVDTTFLAMAVDGFDEALGILLAADAPQFVNHDSALWHAALTAAPHTPGQPLHVDATITDASGAPQANTAVVATMLHDDFFLSKEQTLMTDASGHVSIDVAAADVDQGMGRRFLHVESGQTYPLVEAVVSVDTGAAREMRPHAR